MGIDDVPARPRIGEGPRIGASQRRELVETCRISRQSKSASITVDRQSRSVREALVQAIQTELDITPELNTGGGTSDGRFIAPLVSEVVELGLPNTTIHKINESTPVQDLESLSRVYATVLEKLFS